MQRDITDYGLRLHMVPEDDEIEDFGCPVGGGVDGMLEGESWLTSPYWRRDGVLPSPKTPCGARGIMRSLATPTLVDPSDANNLHLVEYVLEFLCIVKPYELCILESVCKQFKLALAARTGEALWRTLVLQKWGSHIAVPEEVELRLTYKQMYERRSRMTVFPIQLAEKAVVEEHERRGSKKLVILETPREVEIARFRLPAFSERGKLQYHLVMSTEPHPLDSASSSPNESRLRALYSPQHDEVLAAVTEYRRSLSQMADPNLNSIRMTDKIVPRFVDLLRSTSHVGLRFELIWVLTNICSGSSADVESVLNAGALPLLISVLSDTNLAIDCMVMEQCLWALGNISGDSPQFCSIVIEHEALVVLHLRLRGIDFHTLREPFRINVAWFLSNCVRARPRAPFWRIRHVVDILCKAIYSVHEVVLADTLWGLYYYMDTATPLEAAYLVTRLDHDMLLVLLASPHLNLLSPVFRLITKLAVCSAGTRQYLLLAGIPNQLHRIVKGDFASSGQQNHTYASGKVMKFLIAFDTWSWEFRTSDLIENYPVFKLLHQEDQ